ncbi:hypothetical protein H310_04974 [Aphanomyces invadans]|uniref:U1-type domain-containing protein n=1 Tax=Aphanomyces invadans TaxID=157072 RepID=A0A024UD58_9STRA|nr:hypothetical protein H310_04974 [Aphanomyces invadans]ETW03558.1 hypothetical protein H310_04974 [Aphanomyces invadans]|eukprot:XP_008867787.1 hypothetical protein H310_04974 [Aphanomyces invadans]
MAKGNKSKRPRPDAKPASSGSLVVVNPALLRSMNKPSAPLAKKQRASNDDGKVKPGAKLPTSQPSKKSEVSSKNTDKPSGMYVCTVCRIPVTTGAKAMHEQGKKHKRAVLEAGGASMTNTSLVDATARSTAPQSAASPSIEPNTPPLQHVLVRDEDVLGVVYYLLETKKIRRAIVALPTKPSGQLTPQIVGGALKQLGFSVSTIHSKTSSSMRKLLLEKFQSTDEGIVVTTEHFAPMVSSNSHSSVVVAIHVHGTPPPWGYAILAPGAVPPSSVPLDVAKPLLQKATSRANLATVIFELQQETQPTDHDAQWVQKLANASGLDVPDAASKSSKCVKLTPTQQKLQALSEKLYIHLATPLDAVGAVNLAKMKEKLLAVGLVAQNAATGMSIHNTRLSAQTQWLDTADGREFGGSWDGHVRHGATKDATSLVVRANLSTTDPWAPNPEPSDKQQWGGLYGKPCGHNEVVMHTLRPFFPQEVLNARVCSRARPAPGNDGYDGCLEYIQWQCRTHDRAMTLWDAEHWWYVARDGRTSRVSKKVLVTKPLSLIRWLVSNLRLQTIRWHGSIAPASLLESLCLALVCGTTQTAQRLPLHVRQCILQYATTGSREAWQRIDLFEKNRH